MSLGKAVTTLEGIIVPLVFLLSLHQIPKLLHITLQLGFPFAASMDKRLGLQF
ncbi:MAG: hypothetical protein PHE79_10470 [Eubacteriales bacterium]|nr:hypothetical protein [Eubacteriales bacterium]